MANTIGENIKRQRMKLGISQEELAKKAEVKYTTLTKIESGVIKNPSVLVISRIAKSLEINVEDLLTGGKNG